MFLEEILSDLNLEDPDEIDKIAQYIKNIYNIADHNDVVAWKLLAQFINREINFTLKGNFKLKEKTCEYLRSKIASQSSFDEVTCNFKLVHLESDESCIDPIALCLDGCSKDNLDDDAILELLEKTYFSPMEKSAEDIFLSNDRIQVKISRK